MTTTLAAFDFDGTLTRADTLGPFLREVAGTPTMVRALAADAPRLALAGIGRGSRDRAKERLLRRLVGGREHAELITLGREYGERVAKTAMRSEMIARLHWHVAEGHDVVIVSASLDIYLDRAADLLGVTTVLCSRLAVDDSGRVTGSLVGANCRGPEKLARIREKFGPGGYELWAYGDSAGDDEMLAAADHAMRIDRRGGRIRLPTP